MLTKKSGWAAVVLLAVGTGAAYTGCTSVYDEVNKVLQGGNGGTGGIGGTACTADCCIPEDCPDTGNACIARTCTDGACGTEYIADGTEALEQTPGNCMIELCDGSGGPKAQFEPVGTPCTVSSGNVCSATGQCVGCNSAADCDSAKPLCIKQACVVATCDDGERNGGETDTDCGGDIATNGCAPCPDGDDCLMGSDCQSQVCKSNKCQVPTCDDDKKNGQEGDVDCGEGCMVKCAPGQGCDQNGDCSGNQCTGANGMCVPNCMDGFKNNEESGIDCGGTCDGCPVGGLCNGKDADCVMGAYCENNVCTTKKNLGVACATNNECLTGVCEPTDLVCCDQACSGTCRSCRLAGDIGTCLDVPEGTNPEQDCTDSMVCDGNGACKKSLGTACSDAGECASGFCSDDVCCDLACTSKCVACNIGAPGMCVVVPKGMEDPGQCENGFVCGEIGAGCVTPILQKKLGEACTMNSECFSGFCRGHECKLALGAPCTEDTKDNCVSYLCINNKCASCTINGMECSDTDCTGQNYCSYPTGHPCSSNNQCFKDTCTNNLCD